MADRIGLFVPKLSAGGYERVIVNLANGLVQQEYTVDLLVCETGGVFWDDVNDNVRIFKLDMWPTPGLSILGAIPPLRRYLSTRPPDILYTGMIHANVASFSSWRLAGQPCPLVLSTHNPPKSLLGLKNRVLIPFARRIYPEATAIVAASEFIAKEVIDYLNVPHDRVETIYNPIVNEELLEQADETPEDEWVLEAPTVLSVGRLHPQKNYPLLLEAFKKLQKNRGNVQLAIIGEGPQRKKIENKIQSLGLEDTVRLLGKVENPYSYMNSAAAFALASNFEGFGNVLVEAMACGTPVVATDCPGGPSEILKDGEFGTLVPIEDPTALAEAIESSLDFEVQSNPEKLQSRAADFTTGSSAKEYGQLFTYICGE